MFIEQVTNVQTCCESGQMIRCNYVTEIEHNETHTKHTKMMKNKKLSYCWETVRRESMPRIAEMDVEMTI